MKQGLGLQELAAQIEHEDKKDYIVPAPALQFDISRDGIFAVGAGPINGSKLTNHAFNQVGTDLGIPSVYRSRLIESGNYGLLEDNVNTLIKQSNKNRMVRTRNGDFRGYLSDSFSTEYDNSTILKAVLPVLGEMGDDIQIQSSGLTDTKMYLKVTSKKLQGEAKVGDPVMGGISIVNSEVGMSFYAESELVYTLACLNGMVRSNSISNFKKMHRGSKQGVGMIYADTTYMTQQAIALQIRDSIRAALSPERFQRTLQQLKETTERKVSGDVVMAVTELGKTVGFTKDEGSSILNYLIQGGDLSQYGLHSAVTRYAQDVESYDRASQLEVIGAKVIELTPKQWKNVAEAA